MVDKKILITGGAGYIGSHLAKKLLESGNSVVILDNLSSGFLEPIGILKKLGDLEFINCDLRNKEKLKEFFLNHQIDTIMHMAAKINVAESIEKPELYHQENYLNGISLTEAMMSAGIKKLIFSSTAAVYGDPQHTPIDENHPTNPSSPYGQTKLDFERYLSKVKNLEYVILRYFNVGGSDPEGLLGKSHLWSQDLLENIMKVALGEKEYLEIFGDDYDTPDGTAIRDFVHVEDIAQAHILALEKINKISQQIFNLGSSQGFSVREIVDKANIIIGRDLPTKIVNRRAGDIAVSIATAQKAKNILGWDPEFGNLDSIIKTDWVWRQSHPFGYTK